MANLDRIVNVQIALNTGNISADGFNQLLIVGPHAYSLTRVETISSADDLLEMGFATTDALYIAATDAFAQIPSPRAVKIGRRAVSSVSVTVGSLLSAGTYTLAVVTSTGANTYTYTNAGGAADAVLAGLKAEIDADTAAAVTAAVSGDTMTLTSATGDFSVSATSTLLITAGMPTESIADTMAAIVQEDNDWYGVVLTSRAQADILAMADWVEANDKLFGTSTAETGAYSAASTTDTLALLNAGQYYRTHYWYNVNADSEYLEAAVMARCFAIAPGGETWANKRLGSVTANNLTETQYNALKAKNGNTFETFRTFAITQNGQVAAGEWIDVIRFRDWLVSEITTNVANALVNNDKVPYTDAGIALIETQVRAALALGQERGGVAPEEQDADGNRNMGYVVSVPLAASVSAATKASRILNDVKFTARLAGAIHVVNITGSLTYENLIVEA